MSQVKIKITLIRVIIFLFLLGLTVSFVTIQTGRLIQTNKSVIRSNKGIEEHVYPVLGGKIQYVQLRSENTANPIMIVLHGGPGEPLSTWDTWYQRPLEKDFLIANWDQRGSGRSYYLDDRKEAIKKPDVYSLIHDLDDLITYLCQRFARDKVVLVGYDWGTWLGTAYAQIHPDKLFAYVGVGQMTKSGQGMATAVAELAVKQAKKHGDKTAMESFYKDTIDVLRLHQYSTQNLKDTRELWHSASAYIEPVFNADWVARAWHTIMSPNLRGDDIRWQMTSFLAPWIKDDINEALLSEFYFGMPVEQRQRYDIPIYIIQGEDDAITPNSITRAYFDQISAPYKRFFLVSNAGHAVFKDAPDEFAQACKEVFTDLARNKPKTTFAPSEDKR